MTPTRTLLERDAERTQIEHLVGRACSDDGVLLLVEGEAGAGKTSLLEAAAIAGRERGVLVLEATGSELEQELAFGVVRSLFESVVVGAAASERRSLLAGAASMAAPVLLPTRARGEPAEPTAMLHGLFWLASNLAARQPLMLVVDDAHWADAPSLRFLAYLVRRLNGLPLLVVVATRARATASVQELLDVLRSSSASERLAPAPLTEAAVGRLATDQFAEEPAAEFVAACHVATGGNPFLVTELLTAAASDRLVPTADNAGRVGQLGPQAVSRSVLARVSRVGSAARGLTESAAVLAGGELRHCAALADLEQAVAARTLDDLAQVGVLRAGGPVWFVHPLVRTAVYDAIPPGRRSLMHQAAAKLLAQEGAGADRVALHLMNAEPSAEPWVVRVLREAASSASARGAPEQAAELLRRALREPPSSAELSAVLLQLGAAELLAREPAAREHLAAALDASHDPGFRADVALLLGRAAVSGGRLAEARELLGPVIDELGPADVGIVARLEAYRSAGGVWDPRFGAELDRQRPRLRTLADHAGPAGRSLLLMLAFRTAFEGGDPQEVIDLVQRGLDGGRLISDESAEAVEITWAARALTFVDALDQADALLDEMADDARRRGSVMGYATTSAWRADVALRRGLIAAVEADARTAIELASAHDLFVITPHAHSFLGEALLEQGEVEQARALLEGAQLGPMQGSRPEVRFLLTRARARLGCGDRDAAIADLRACQAHDSWFSNPNVLAWRSTLALALPATAHDEAVELADVELAQARRLGQARAIGVALRALGLLAKGHDQIALLRTAVFALERSPSGLEQARARADLGAALRRSNARVEAREVLAAALDTASACGARAVAEHARRELVTAGARPRRERRTGVESLTESERRVARMAADGITNREIAQALFVTMKTVALHLTRTYQKLGITGRAELADAFARS